MSANADPLYVQQVNLWRDSYNPLRGLTMRHIVQLIEQGERGEYAGLMWLYRKIEKSHHTIRALKKRRLAAIAKLDWDIRIPDTLPEGATEAMAKKQQKFLRSMYERIRNLRRAYKFLALAEFRGFSHLEKHYDNQGNIVKLQPVPQYHWIRQGSTGPWFYNADAQPKSYTYAGLVKIDTAHFVIREEEDPINEVAVKYFLRSSMGDKDFDAFMETFGIASLLLELPPNIPAGKESEFQAMAEKVASNARGVAPAGTKPHVLESNQGTAPFESYLRRMDECIVMAGTSGKLTMLAESGSGTLAGSAHADVFDDLAMAEGGEISEVFQEYVDLPALLEAFPGQPICAYFTLNTQERVDVAGLVKNYETLKRGGLEIDLDEMQEKTGYKLTRVANQQQDKSNGNGNNGLSGGGNADAPDKSGEKQPIKNRAYPATPTPATSARAAQDALLDQSIAEWDKAELLVLRPLIDEIEQLLAAPEADFATIAAALQDRLPAILEAMNESPATAEVLERLCGASMLTSLTGGDQS